MYNILVCDDDKDIVTAIKIYLTNENYNILTAFNGKNAIDIINTTDVHLVLLDIMMPVMDGVETLINIRRKSNVPVIFLTAKSEDSDKIVGLNVGADDYITKPFNPAELQARVKSQLRRYMLLGSGRSEEEFYSVGPLSLNDRNKEVFLDGEKINLTKTEYDILKFLMENKGKVFSPAQIYENVWDEVSYGADNIVPVHIRHLREKIEINPAEPRYLKVVWGMGYKMEDNV